MKSHVLSDVDFEKMIQSVPVHHRAALMSHNAVLKHKLQDDSTAQIVRWLREISGDAQTVRALHAKKLADRIEAGEFKEQLRAAS